MSIDNHNALPEGRDIAFLSLGVIGIGTSGPVIALSTMPVPTLIFWRNLGGALTMFPFALAKKNGKTRSKDWRCGGRSFLERCWLSIS